MKPIKIWAQVDSKDNTTILGVITIQLFRFSLILKMPFISWLFSDKTNSSLYHPCPPRHLAQSCLQEHSRKQGPNHCQGSNSQLRAWSRTAHVGPGEEAERSLRWVHLPCLGHWPSTHAWHWGHHSPELRPELLLASLVGAEEQQLGTFCMNKGTLDTLCFICLLLKSKEASSLF